MIRLALPSFASNYWTKNRFIGPIFLVLARWRSVRAAYTLEIIRDFLLREPWHAAFGVGYKTLPYSHFVGERVIVDNTWLSLFAETGLFGLGSFLLLNVLILRTVFARRGRASREPRFSANGYFVSGRVRSRRCSRAT